VASISNADSVTTAGPVSAIAAGDAEKPTSVRHVMMFLATAVAVLLYLDRVCISPAASSVAKDLGISPTDLDKVLGAFFLTYALAQIPAGWLGDRFGARWVLGGYLILWSLVTGMMGFVTSLTGILYLRYACGIFQAGAYPIAAGVVRRWIPVQQRGLASSVIAIGGRLGGAVAPVLTIQLMLLWTYGTDRWSIAPTDQASVTSWRPVLGLYGVVGVGFGIALWIIFRDWPHEHPSVNAKELELIRRGDIPLPSGNQAASLKWPPIVPMLLSVPLWMVSFVQFASNLGWAFLVTKMPQYLEEVYQTTQQNQGWLQSLPLAAGICGLFLGGVLTDRLTRLFGLRWGRSIGMGLSRLIVALSFLALLLVDSAFGAALCLVAIGFSTDLGTPACWAYGQDVGGRHVGSVFGWSNMWGNLGAALSPVLFGQIILMADSPLSGWKYAFVTCAVVNILATIASFGINAKRPVVQDH